VNVPTYPYLPYGKLTVEVRYKTDVAQFDTPHQVRSARWTRSVRTLTIAYELLDEAWWQNILDLFERQKGGLSEFRFDDYVTPSPMGRQFGVGDGKTRVFHLPHDYTSGAVIYADGAKASAVYVDAETGRVEFETAPARGVELTYDADDAGFRVRFADDGFAYERLHWGAYAATVKLEQVTDQQDLYPIRQIVCGGTIAHATLDATGDAIAYSFVCPCDVTADDASYYLSAITDPGTVRVSLCEDDSGEPGAVLGYGEAVPAGAGWQTVSFGVAADLARGERYWLVVAAQSGAWDGTHKCDVQYTSGVPDPIPGEDQDDFLWGGYVIADRRCQNTPHSWLGVVVGAGVDVWGPWLDCGMANVALPTQIACTNHGFTVDDQVVFLASVGVGIVAGTIYWVVGVPDVHHFEVSETQGGAPMEVYDGIYEDPNHVRVLTAPPLGSRDPTSHPAFFLNQVPEIVGHCQAPLTQPVYGLTRTRESFPIDTLHDILIHKVGAVFSTVGAPADSLHYAITFDSDPPTIQRTGILSAPVDTDGAPEYMEAFLTQPLLLPVGEGVNIVFYSAGSAVGAPWTHWGHKDSELDYAIGWVPNWDFVRWDGPAPYAKVSIDGGMTYPTLIRGAWTLRCMGTMQP
jgi:uncharacterized protein (TIGR02217 family)